MFPELAPLHLCTPTLFARRLIVAIDKVNSKIQQVMAKYSPLQWDDWKLEYSVVPLSKRHLDSADTQKRLMIFGFLGFSVFFVAIMNYMLFSIATISRRAKA